MQSLNDRSCLPSGTGCFPACKAQGPCEGTWWQGAQLGRLCGEGSRGRGFSTSHLIGKELEEPVAQVPWPTEGTALFLAEAVGVQDRDSPTAQPQVALCCPPQYSHQSGQLKFPLTRSSGAALHLFD